MPATLSATLRALAPELDRKLGCILMALRPLIARHFCRHPWVPSAVTGPLWNRLGIYAGRFSRLMARIAAGRLPLPRARVPGDPGRPVRPVNRKPRPPIPRQRGWMLHAVGHHAAVYRNQLERLLAEPAMAELLAASPGAGRILRPLCHMLGLPPPCKPPGRPSRALPPPAPEARPAPPPAALAPPPPATRASPFLSLTLRRERYVCLHFEPA